MNNNLPEVLKIVLFSKDYNLLTKDEKLEAIKLALGSNKEEMYIAKFDHNYGAIQKIKRENEILNKLAMEIRNE